jgi:hypothetical protein
MFAARFLDYGRPWARTPVRCVGEILSVGWALGGRGTATAQLAALLGLGTTDQTDLRLLRNAPPPTHPPVTVWY